MLGRGHQRWGVVVAGIGTIVVASVMTCPVIATIVVCAVVAAIMAFAGVATLAATTATFATTTTFALGVGAGGNYLCDAGAVKGEMVGRDGQRERRGSPQGEPAQSG